MLNNDEFANDNDVFPPSTLIKPVEKLRSELRAEIDYLKGDPSPADVALKFDSLLGLFDESLIHPEIQIEISELASLFSFKVERSDKWPLWENRLFKIYTQITDTKNTEAIGKFYTCMMRFYLNRGDSLRADFLANYFSDPKHPSKQPADPAAIEAYFAAATIAIDFSKLGNSPTQIKKRIAFAKKKGDLALLGHAYGLMFHFYMSRQQPEKAIAYAQMVYLIGSRLNQSIKIIHGLNYMAVAFQQCHKPHLALDCANRASAICHLSGDQPNFLWPVYAACYYELKDYEQAEYYFSGAVKLFEGCGHYYAATLHSYGLALMQLDRFSQAIQVIQQAISLWQNLKRPVSKLYAEHALAHLYLLMGDACKAAEYGRELLVTAKSLGKSCPEAFLKLLKTDVEDYKNACKATQSEVQRELSMVEEKG